MIIPKPNRFLCLVTLALLAGASAMAQLQVSGRVVDPDRVPIPGAHVVVKGTVTGTITSTDGSYNLHIPGKSAVLSFSFVGYETVVRKVKESGEINVELRPAPELAPDALKDKDGVYDFELAKLSRGKRIVKRNSAQLDSMERVSRIWRAKPREELMDSLDRKPRYVNNLRRRLEEMALPMSPLYYLGNAPKDRVLMVYQLLYDNDMIIDEEHWTFLSIATPSEKSIRLNKTYQVPGDSLEVNAWFYSIWMRPVLIPQVEGTVTFRKWRSREVVAEVHLKGTYDQYEVRKLLFSDEEPSDSVKRKAAMRDPETMEIVSDTVVFRTKGKWRPKKNKNP